jgi:hypothetical protein
MIGWVFRKLLGTPNTPERAAADTPGAETSEGKIVFLNTLVAALMALAAMFWPDLPQEELREVLLYVAGIMFAGSSAAYSYSRAKVKTELARVIQDMAMEKLWSELPASELPAEVKPRTPKKKK